ncbi:hypothetical protein EVAR_98132_1 [Eumeta japonica]|uniref:Uncharacterized protein n=1 Tax=Eumeta variegata TaxID=151549 RepID=A0A4C1XNW1_EUMVA|nr:hypothetical protein EVAR_98132_1 [Eumeta japonica]
MLHVTTCCKQAPNMPVRLYEIALPGNFEVNVLKERKRRGFRAPRSAGVGRLRRDVRRGARRQKARAGRAPPPRQSSAGRARSPGGPRHDFPRVITPTTLLEPLINITLIAGLYARPSRLGLCLTIVIALELVLTEPSMCDYPLRRLDPPLLIIGRGVTQREHLSP